MPASFLLSLSLCLLPLPAFHVSSTVRVLNTNARNGTAASTGAVQGPRSLLCSAQSEHSVKAATCPDHISRVGESSSAATVPVSLIYDPDHLDPHMLVSHPSRGLSPGMNADHNLQDRPSGYYYSLLYPPTPDLILFGASPRNHGRRVRKHMSLETIALCDVDSVIVHYHAYMFSYSL